MYDIAAETRAGVPMSDILESTTAHEVVHQWFYNLVGNDQLDEPWLDESMTGYQTYRYYVDRYGQSAGDGYFANFAARWESVDRAEIPIGRPVRLCSHSLNSHSWLLPRRFACASLNSSRQATSRSPRR